jgi:hypothetical protein
MRIRQLARGLCGCGFLVACLMNLGCSSFRCSQCGAPLLGRPFLAKSGLCPSPGPVICEEPVPCGPYQPCASWQSRLGTCFFTLRYWPRLWPFHAREECVGPAMVPGPIMAAPPAGMYEPGTIMPPAGPPVPVEPMLDPGKPNVLPSGAEPNLGYGSSYHPYEQPSLVVRLTAPIRRGLDFVKEEMGLSTPQPYSSTGPFELVVQSPQELRSEEISRALPIAGKETPRDAVMDSPAAATQDQSAELVPISFRDAAEPVEAASGHLPNKHSLFVKIFDLEDPAPENGELEYLIQITNPRTLPALDLSLSIACPAELQPLGVSYGPVGVVQGQTVCIPKIDIGPCGTRMVRIKVRPLKAGDTCIQVKLHGEDSNNEIKCAESTRILSATE